jgi:hypothetical protein
VEAGALSGLPLGKRLAPSVFGAAEFGAAPVVDEGVGFPVPLPGVPSIGVADCAYTSGAAASIATPETKPKNDVFRISYPPHTSQHRCYEKVAALPRLVGG